MSQRNYQPESPERVASALAFVDPTDRDTWVKMAMATKAALGDLGFDIWNSWSEGSDSYSVADARDVWRSAKETGGTGAATLFWHARNNGWKDDGSFQAPPALTAEQIAAREAQRAHEAAEDAARRAAAANLAQTLRDAGSKEISDHPYIKRKGAGLKYGAGIRRGSFPQRGWDDALLVPIYGADRNVMSLEAISVDGEKIGLKDGARSGGFYPVGQFMAAETNPSRIVIIAEGLATAAACQAATGYPAVVAFSVGNLRGAGETVKRMCPDARLVVAADLGAEVKARAAAVALGACLVVPQGEGLQDGNDFWDARDILGGKLVAAHFEEAIAAGPLEAEPPAHMAEELPAEVAEQAVQDLDAALRFADVEELPEGTPWIAQPLSVQADRTPAAAGSTSVLSSATLAGCEELGILPLGTISDMYAFWRRDTGTLELIRAKDVGSESSFLRLATKQGWEFWCTENGGKYDRSAIANALIQASKLLGQMELSRIPSSLATPEHVEAEYARAMLAVKPSAGMLSQMIAAHPDWKGADLWFDEFANDIKSTGEPPCGGGAGSWTDHHDVLMCGWVAAQWGANVSKSCAAEAVLLLAAQNKRHPVREYLNSLTWDGTPRLDNWLVELVGCPADIYTQAVGPKTLIGAVARVMRPGCKHDTVLILEGEQGKRKSTLVASLLPNDAWFAEDLGADIGSKDAMDGLAGKWIVELAELANMEKSESKAIKSFIARKTDRYRPSYGKRSMDFKRQTILIGTVNPEGDGRYLKDPTGGRRFWPIKCGDINIERAVEIRDQLWAEAAARFKNGESWWLNDEQEVAASKVQSERQEDNHWLDRVERYLTHFAPTGPGTGWGGKRASKLQVVVVSDIFEAVIGRPYMKRDVSESRNIADALRSLGWQYKPSGYIEGRKCRHWAAPGYRGQDNDTAF